MQVVARALFSSQKWRRRRRRRDSFELWETAGGRREVSGGGGAQQCKELKKSRERESCFCGGECNFAVSLRAVHLQKYSSTHTISKIVFFFSFAGGGARELEMYVTQVSHGGGGGGGGFFGERKLKVVVVLSYFLTVMKSPKPSENVSPWKLLTILFLAVAKSPNPSEKVSP